MEENNAHKEDLIYQYACVLQLWVVAEWKMGKKGERWLTTQRLKWIQLVSACSLHNSQTR